MKLPLQREANLTMGAATSGGTATVPPRRTVHLVRPVRPGHDNW